MIERLDCQIACLRSGETCYYDVPFGSGNGLQAGMYRFMWYLAGPIRRPLTHTLHHVDKVQRNDALDLLTGV